MPSLSFLISKKTSTRKTTDPKPRKTPAPAPESVLAHKPTSAPKAPSAREVAKAAKGAKKQSIKDKEAEHQRSLAANDAKRIATAARRDREWHERADAADRAATADREATPESKSTDVYQMD
jgi:hypothetical protein